MKVQSLSIVVPNKKCVNNCKFCVANMLEEDYKNQLENPAFYDLYEIDYKKRLEFARDNGCNVVMLTGNSEPQQNRGFLKMFGTMNKSLNNPFKCIEMQTTGVMLNEEYLRFLRNHVGVTTISVSLSSFDDDVNAEYEQANPKLYVPLVELCDMIKKYDFNLRLSINLTDSFNNFNVQNIFDRAKKFGADQVTFRVLYESNLETDQNKWMQIHRADYTLVDTINKYILKHGRPLERLEFGAMKYSVDEMSTVLDNDCMSIKEQETLKYLILRENCKLYTKWDDKGSLLF